MTASKAPTGLGKRGRQLWQDVAGAYELRPIMIYNQGS